MNGIQKRSIATTCAVLVFLAALVAPVGATTVYLSGNLSGTYAYPNKDVVIDGNCTLLGNVLIRSTGGSITVNSSLSIDGHGTNGSNGAPGTAGQSGYNLTLETLPLIGGPISIRGSVTINSGVSINLVGGNGGNGDGGANADCDDSATDGSEGGAGGNGGSFAVYSCKEIIIGDDVSVTTSGGNGGDGGWGGQDQILGETVDRSCGDGGWGGNSGTAGTITLSQTSGSTTAESIIIGEDCSFTANGGDGGDGGDGGENSNPLHAPNGAKPGEGGPAAPGANGQAISITGKQIHIDQGGCSFSTKGGASGKVGDGGRAGFGACVDTCDDDDPPVASPSHKQDGGVPGLPSAAGDGGTVTIQNTSGLTLSISGLTINTTGGNGGNGGDGGIGSLEYDCESDCMGGGNGKVGSYGGEGGTAGAISVSCSTSGATLTFTTCIIVGNGGTGGKGGDGGASPACCFCYDIGQNGGGGASGGVGSTVTLTATTVNVTDTTFEINGGDGGDGGDGGSYLGVGGAGATGGQTGSLAITATTITGYDAGNVTTNNGDLGDDGDDAGSSGCSEC